ncbi:hypothetical protein [Haladaptatus halobius]|uniref:hypothetical protein n=1 Tax=Haladaptatus halobius TaxID=2884875 RepID=UPI001D0A2991|nr:hypothetical protein [Haladaptatus halobius]
MKRTLHILMALAVVATVFSGAFATPALAGGYDKADDRKSGDTQSNQCTQSGDSASGSGTGGLAGVGVGANVNALNTGDNQEQTCSNVD